MKQGSKLVLSGLLRSDEGSVVNTYVNNGFKLISRNAKKDWLVLVLELKNKKNEKSDGMIAVIRYFYVNKE